MPSTVEKEIQDVLKKHKHTLGYEFDFPQYRVLPDEVKLALRVLESHGLRVLIRLREEKKKQ